MLLRYLTTFADWRSLQTWRKLRDGAYADRALVGIRFRSLGGHTVWMRPGTTDFDVVSDTLLNKLDVINLPPGSGAIQTVLDLGSNIGVTMALYASRFPTAQVLGVELDQSNVEVCRRNITPYGSRCRVMWGAAWTRDGTVTYDASDEAWGFKVCSQALRPRKAPAYAMTSLIEECGGRVDYCKMDIEGAERELLGDASWIDRVSVLKVEVHKPYTVDQCREDLSGYGLRIRIHPTHPSSLVAYH